MNELPTKTNILEKSYPTHDPVTHNIVYDWTETSEMVTIPIETIPLGCDEGIPEFPTIAIPTAIALGIIFLVFRRKRKY